MPKAKILDASARVPGTDGEKMSKSYGNTIEVFEDPKEARKKIMRIKTDSRPMDQPKDPAGDHLFQLYALFATAAQREEMAAKYRRGGFGYGEVKRPWPIWPRATSPKPAAAAASWRPNPSECGRSSPKGPPVPGRRPPRSCSGRERRAG